MQLMHNWPVPTVIVLKRSPCPARASFRRCHTGPCTQTCRGLVEKTCSCGKTTKVVQVCELRGGLWACAPMCMPVRHMYAHAQGGTKGLL